MNDDQILDGILGIGEAAPKGDATPPPADDPGVGAEPQAEPEPQKEEPQEEEEAAASEPAPEGKKFFYFDEEEVKDLPPEAIEKLAAKDRMLRNRFTQKRQTEAEAYRKAMDTLEAERQEIRKQQDKVMDAALRVLPVHEAPRIEAKESPVVARLKAAGWDEESIAAVRELASEVADAQTAPLREQTAQSRALADANSAIDAVREQYKDVPGLEAEMEKLVATDTHVQEALRGMSTPAVRAEYVAAVAYARMPKAPEKPSEEEVRKAATQLAKEAMQKKAASPTRGGASQIGQGPSKSKLDQFVTDLFTPSTPYG